VYHFLALRSDGRAAQAALASQHSAFPVAILGDQSLVDEKSIRENLQRTAPNIPVEGILVENLNKETLARYKALVFSSTLIRENPDAFRLAQNEYSGQRLVITEPGKGWTWQGLIQRSRLDSAKETARLIRMMAENQEIQPASSGGGLTVIAYILAGMFGLQVLIMIISVIVGSFVR
jgi:hypothetical protein